MLAKNPNYPLLVIVGSEKQVTFCKKLITRYLCTGIVGTRILEKFELLYSPKTNAFPFWLASKFLRFVSIQSGENNWFSL